MSLPRSKTQALIRKAVLDDRVEPQMVKDKLVLKADGKRFVLSKGDTTFAAGRFWADLKSQPLPKARPPEQNIVTHGSSEFLSTLKVHIGIMTPGTLGCKSYG